jgi:hypothetical protein
MSQNNERALWSILAYLVTGLLVWGAIGYGIDKWVGKHHYGIIGGLVRTVSIGTSLALDASSSYDIDYRRALLNYSWTCWTVAPTYGSSCTGFTDSGYKLLVVDTNTLANATLEQSSFLMSVYVSNSFGSQSSQSVTVIVIGNPIPSVSISHSCIHLPIGS